MSARSGSPSDEGEGDIIRPHGEDRDSSEESSDEDPEEARRIAEGFIVEDEEDGDGDGDQEEDEETMRRRRKEKRKKRRLREKRERRERERQDVLSDDELELLEENRGRLGGPSKSRPLKRLRQRSDSGASDEAMPTLQDMFREDEERRYDDDDDDDLGDFIEEDEEEGEAGGETEEQRRVRRREEKVRRRAANRTRPDLAGVDRGSWDEIYAVFGDGGDYDWALEGEEGMDIDDEDEVAKKDLRLEDVRRAPFYVKY